MQQGTRRHRLLVGLSVALILVVGVATLVGSAFALGPAVAV